MDSAKLNDWMQVIGIFALVASLMFVGLQMKQAQEIALSQTFQLRTDSTMEMLLSAGENPLFVSAFSKAMAGNSESLNEVEQVTLQQYAIAMLYLTENLHYQYVNGFVTEDRWLSGLSRMEEMINGSVPIPVRESFERNPFAYSGEYRKEIEDLIAKVDGHEK